MNSKNKKIFNKLLDKNKISKKIVYGLSPNSLFNDDIIEGIKVLLSKKITMGNITKKFEEEFSKYIGTKYALMVNSGSSANLLALFGLINPLKKDKLRFGDEVLIPALCWSTSLWPIVQAGLKPVFVETDPKTLNISIEDLKKKITKKTKAIMLVHVLGNCANMDQINSIIRSKNITLIEDTCESLGSKYKNKFLGSYGTFGSFSFYYSHQITSGEGGMIVCNSRKDYEIIHSLRSHGWDRGLKSNNKNFNFINSGFNLRPTEIAAAIGYNQFKKLNSFKKTRSNNRKLIIKKLINSKKWRNQYQFISSIKHLDPSWFGLPLLLNKKYIKQKARFLTKINKKGLETRPIISGNFVNQKSVKLYNLNPKKEKFHNTQNIEDRGFFIGIHLKKISNSELNFLEKNLLDLDEN